MRMVISRWMGWERHVVRMGSIGMHIRLWKDMQKEKTTRKT
jgi:hypothetical protein